MKQIIFILVLGLGLVTLSACGLSKKSDYSQESKPAETAAGLSQAPEASGTPTEAPAPLAPGASFTLVDGSYDIKPANALISWRAAKVTAAHTGLVSMKSGELKVEGNALTGGSFIMDMSTITSDEKIDALVKHLKSADFFDAATYPEAQLVIRSVKPGVQAGEYAVNADLTIKDITAPVDFVAKVSQIDKLLEAQARISIDRTIWGLKYGSGKFFQDLGDKMIDDQITFDVVIRTMR